MISFGQNKKKQIEANKIIIDSLNSVLSTTIVNSTTEINLLNTKIDSLNSFIKYEKTKATKEKEQVEKQVYNLNRAIISGLKTEKVLINKIDSLSNLTKKLKDSIKLIQTRYSHSFIVFFNTFVNSLDTIDYLNSNSRDKFVAFYTSNELGYGSYNRCVDVAQPLTYGEDALFPCDEFETMYWDVGQQLCNSKQKKLNTKGKLPSIFDWGLNEEIEIKPKNKYLNIFELYDDISCLSLYFIQDLNYIWYIHSTNLDGCPQTLEDGGE